MIQFSRVSASLVLAALCLSGCGSGSAGGSAPDENTVDASVPPILDGLVLRLESTVGVSFMGTSVATWADQSGSGNDLSASGDPSWDSMLTPSGRPAIVLDGFDDRLGRVHSLDPIRSLPTGNGDRTMFVVARYNALTWSGGAAYGTDAPNQAFGLGVRHPAGALMLQGFGQGADLDSTTPGLGVGWIMQAATLNSGLATLFQDETPIAEWNHDYDTVLSRFVIGQEIADLGFVAMDVAAVLVYERALTTTERRAVGAYLRKKYIAPGGPNAAPTVAFRTPSQDSEFEQGQVVRLEASASDPEDGNIAGAIAWTSDRDGALGSGPALESSTLSLGRHAITASVADEGGLLGSAAITLTVTPANTAPGVRITAPLDGSSIEEGELVQLVGHADDATDGDLTDQIAWSSSLDGPLGTGARLGSSTLSVGQHGITASVTDSGGLSGDAAITLTVTANTPPVVSITSPLDGSIFVVGAPVQLAGTAQDTRDGDLAPHLTWSSSLDGSLGVGASLSAPSLSLGQHSITASATDSGGLLGSSAISLTVTGPGNTAPVVTITSPVDGASIEEGLVVAFAGMAIDADDGDLTSQLAWRSSLDGPLGAGGAVSSSTLSVGTHTITASVTDAGGLLGSAMVTLTVNSAPVVAITGPVNGSSFEDGLAVRLTGTATDATDGDLTAHLAWRSSLDGPLGTGGAVTSSSLSVGLHRITASATDSGGLTGDAAITLSVTANTPPVVAITSPADGATFKEGSLVQLAGTASDVRDGNLAPQLAWSSSLDGPLGTGPSASSSTLSVGTHTITASVTDAGGLSGSAMVTLTVNSAPVVAITGPVNGSSFEEGVLVRLTGTATDATDGDLTAQLEWRSSLDGSMGVGGAVSSSSLSVGLHRITASATDSGGLTGDAAITLSVTANTPPVVAITSPTDGAVFVEGMPVQLSGVASDVRDGDLAPQLAWSSSLDGPLGAGASLTSSTLSVGTHTITASVTDAGGLSGSAMVTLTVNSAPVVAITGPVNGSSFEEGVLVRLTGTATDATDGDLTTQLAWRSSLDGSMGVGGAVSSSSLSVGQHRITASTTDSGGLTGDAAITLSVTANTPPVVAITSPADGAVFVEGMPVQLSGVASDVRDGNLAPQLAWSSSLDGPLGTGASMASSSLSVGAHTITASVTDAGGLSGSAMVTVTVNSAPVVAITGPVNGSSFEEGVLVRLTGTATDATDGDLTAQLEWRSSLDGSMGVGGAVSSSSLSVGQHRITASTTDSGGLTGDAAITLSVTANTPPVVAITSPADGVTFVEGSLVQLAGTASDVRDGNLAPQLAWSSSLDGPLGTGPSASSSTLSVGTHTITASVTDAGGLSGSAMVTLTVNSAPLVAITGPVNGSSFEDGLAVRLTGTATDATDGDLTTQLAWRSSLDGSMGVGGAVSSSSLSVGQHRITASTTDSGGLTGDAAITLSVTVNTPPVVAITSPTDGAVFVEGMPVQLSGVASDVRDGDLAPQLAWSSSLDGPLGAGASLTSSTLSVGTHTITASVTDVGGLSGSAMVTLTVNSAPVVAITGPVIGSSFEEGVLVRLTGTATDATDGDLTAQLAWRSSLDGSLGVGGAVSSSSLSVGQHRITASATDSGGLTGDAAITLSVTANTAPLVAITSPAGGSIFAEGALIRLVGTADDVRDGDMAEHLAWSSSLDGPLGMGASVESSILSLGAHTIMAAVTDAGGLPGSSSVTVTVSPNAAPVVAITTPRDNAIVAEGVHIPFTGTAIGTGGGDIAAQIAWSSSLDGALGMGASVGSSTLSVGAHTITASVTDGGGQSGQASMVLSVSDVPLVPASPIALFDGESLEGLQPWFSSTGFSDPDQVFRVEEGVLRVSGQHLGGLATLASYRDYVIVFEFRWGADTWNPRLNNARDSGLLLHCHGVEGGWRGTFLASIQAQMMEGGTGDVILLDGRTPIQATAFVDQVPCGHSTWNCRGGYVWSPSGLPQSLRGFPDIPTLHWGGWDPNWVDDKGFRGVADVESPIGDWNQLVVAAAGSTLEVFLNGVKVNEVVDAFPNAGRIQIESEYAEFFVRRMELLPLGAPVGATIATHALPLATAGVPYDEPLAAVGGRQPLSWSLVGGALPQGLILDRTSGNIAGVPAAGGRFPLVFCATDAEGVPAESELALEVVPVATSLPTDGLVLQLEASEFASPGPVSSWSDQSGLGNHVFAAGNPNVALAETPSGLPAVIFAGLNDKLERLHATHALNGLPTANEDRSAFFVVRYDGCEAWGGMAYGRGTGNQAFGLGVRHPSGELYLQGYGFGGDLVSTTPGIGAGWAIHSAVLASGQATMFQNGTQIAQWNHAYDTQLLKFVIGEEIAGLGHIDAAVAAVLLYDRALSDSERLEVETFLSAKYLR